MVIWIVSCRASSVVDKGMSMRRQIFGSSSCSSMRSRATRSPHGPVPSVFQICRHGLGPASAIVNRRIACST